MNKPIILAICGKSCVGKDSLSEMLLTVLDLLDCSTHKITSITTRPPRENEKDGINYHFVSTSDFLSLGENNEFLEYTEFRGWHYGTLKNEISNNALNIGIFNPEGLLKLKKYKSEYTIIPVYLKENIFTRLERSYFREGKWKFEYLRRAFVDFKDFIRINDILQCFDSYIEIPRKLTNYQKVKKIIRYLEKEKILDYGKNYMMI